MKNYYKNRGFTLVELMVSMGITAILMVGMATFFSSTFSSMFMAREKVANSQGQFVVSTILGGKFVNVDKLEEIDPNGDFVVLRNDMETGDLPFTYIGKETIADAEHIVFKDFFVFNGQDGVWKSVSGTGPDMAGLKNPAGIANIGSNNYVVVPLENKIYKCNQQLDSCSGPLNITPPDKPLDHPMDITTDGNSLYITDSGNNRIIKVVTPDRNPVATVLYTDHTTFNYPTGITYYNYGPGYLFVADTYNHLVKRINLATNTITIVAGDGDDDDCDNTARFCKLNFPTGLMVYDNELYISDTGNGRVLKISDAGKPSNFTMEFLSPEDTVAIKEIKIVFPTDVDHSFTDLDSVTGLTENGNTHKDDTETFEYRLWTILDENTLVTNVRPEPDPNTMDRISVADNDLFEVGDTLRFVNDANNDFEVVNNINQIISLKNNFAIDHLSGEEVILTTPVPANTKITFDLSNVNTANASSGFSAIDIEMYDETNTLIETRQHFFRIGDDELGTFEDTIEVVSGHEADDFPTGLGLDIDEEWTPYLVVSDTPKYSLDFSDSGYDYVSDFDVEPGSFGFSTSNEDGILELEFEAILGLDVEGQPILENNILNSNIKE